MRHNAQQSYNNVSLFEDLFSLIKDLSSWIRGFSKEIGKPVILGKFSTHLPHLSPTYTAGASHPAASFDEILKIGSVWYQIK